VRRSEVSDPLERILVSVQSPDLRPWFHRPPQTGHRTELAMHSPIGFNLEGIFLTASAEDLYWNHRRASL